MSENNDKLIRRVEALEALFNEGQQLTSRLKQELAPVEAPARPKGSRTRQPSKAELAVMKRNKRIQR